MGLPSDGMRLSVRLYLLCNLARRTFFHSLALFVLNKMQITWVYCSEIFPLDIRMLCVALTTADQVSTPLATVSRFSNKSIVALEFHHLPNDSIHDHITRLRDLHVLW